MYYGTHNTLNIIWIMYVYNTCKSNMCEKGRDEDVSFVYVCICMCVCSAKAKSTAEIKRTDKKGKSYMMTVVRASNVNSSI